MISDKHLLVLLRFRVDSLAQLLCQVEQRLKHFRDDPLFTDFYIRLCSFSRELSDITDCSSKDKNNERA